MKEFTFYTFFTPKLVRAGFSVFILFSLVIPCYGQNLVKSEGIIQQEISQLKALIVEQQKKLLFQFHLINKNYQASYINITSFSNKDQPCLMELTAITSYGTKESLPLKKTALVYFDKEIQSPMIQPHESPGLFKNSIFFHNGILYFPDDHSPQQMNANQSNFWELSRMCSKLGFLQDVVKENEAFTKSTCPKGDKGEKARNEKMKWLEYIVKIMGNTNFMTKETISGEDFYDVPL